MSEPIPTTSLRLPQNLLDRADRLVSPIDKSGERDGALQTTRSDVLRIALARGLMELEYEYGTRRRR